MIFSENRPPLFGIMLENKREDRCPPFCNFAAFAAYRNRRRVRVFARLLERPLARLGAVTPLRLPLFVTPP
jgi:hypothetical protein